ncbi:MAG: hypothetical protein ACFFD8_04940 [Candidatus Thorarchaeota archaeon]
MDANEHTIAEPKKAPSLAELLHISPQAVSFYFELTTEDSSLSQEEIQEKYRLSGKKTEEYLKALQTCGLVRRNPDKTFEAVAPIEAVLIILTRVRDLLRQLQQDFPQQLDKGLPPMSDSIRKELDTFPYQLNEVRSIIDKTLTKTFSAFKEKTIASQMFPTFESFTDNLYLEILGALDERLMETRNQLNDFESLEAFVNVLNKLKNDVADIVNISLSDMREQAFRLHELDEFRETLAELWNITPSIVEGHLADFEQEMSELEASLGDLMETKYRLGAFKGVIENFAKEHILTAVKTLKTNFQLSLTEAIQDHLQQAMQRFEKVSKTAHHEFEKLREQLANWVRNALDLAFGEVIQRNQQAATNLASRLESLTRTFQERFVKGLDDSLLKVKLQARELDGHLLHIPAIIDELRNQEISPHVREVMDRSEKQLTDKTHEIFKLFSGWRNTYINITGKQVKSLLEEAEGQVTIATQRVNQFWQQSKESEPAIFDLYKFVIGEKEFNSNAASLIARSRNQLFIILPRTKSVKVKLLRMIPRNVNVRIVVSDLPDSKSVMSVKRVVANKPNFQLRHDPRGDIWGIIRDSEEILLGNTSKGTANIVGITSSHEDHIELLRSIMETRWLHARNLAEN